jgi:hypothetical protein
MISAKLSRRTLLPRNLRAASFSSSTVFSLLSTNDGNVTDLKICPETFGSETLILWLALMMIQIGIETDKNTNAETGTTVKLVKIGMKKSVTNPIGPTTSARTINTSDCTRWRVTLAVRHHFTCK